MRYFDNTTDIRFDAVVDDADDNSQIVCPF